MCLCCRSPPPHTNADGTAAGGARPQPRTCGGLSTGTQWCYLFLWVALFIVLVLLLASAGLNIEQGNAYNDSLLAIECTVLDSSPAQSRPILSVMSFGAATRTTVTYHVSYIHDASIREHFVTRRDAFPLEDGTAFPCFLVRGTANNVVTEKIPMAGAYVSIVFITIFLFLSILILIVVMWYARTCGQTPPAQTMHPQHRNYDEPSWYSRRYRNTPASYMPMAQQRRMPGQVVYNGPPADPYDMVNPRATYTY